MIDLKRSASSHYKRMTLEMNIIPLNIEHAKQLCDWKYDSPYQIYGWPSWERMQIDGIEFGDPVLRQVQYHAVVNEQSELIGFAQLFPILGVTRLGLGLRPDLCSQGIGPAFAKFIAEEALLRAPQNTIDLEVFTWNSRAIRAYVKAGFHIEDTYTNWTRRGAAQFHCMVYKKDEPN